VIFTKYWEGYLPYFLPDTNLLELVYNQGNGHPKVRFTGEPKHIGKRRLSCDRRRQLHPQTFYLLVYFNISYYTKYDEMYPLLNSQGLWDCERVKCGEVLHIYTSTLNTVAIYSHMTLVNLPNFVIRRAVIHLE
jgi:hypothetical protein